MIGSDGRNDDDPPYVEDVESIRKQLDMVGAGLTRAQITSLLRAYDQRSLELRILQRTCADSRSVVQRQRQRLELCLDRAYDAERARDVALEQAAMCGARVQEMEREVTRLRAGHDPEVCFALGPYEACELCGREDTRDDERTLPTTTDTLRERDARVDEIRMALACPLTTDRPEVTDGAGYAASADGGDEWGAPMDTPGEAIEAWLDQYLEQFRDGLDECPCQPPPATAQDCRCLPEEFDVVRCVSPDPLLGSDGLPSTAVKRGVDDLLVQLHDSMDECPVDRAWPDSRGTGANAAHLLELQRSVVAALRVYLIAVEGSPTVPWWVADGAYETWVPDGEGWKKRDE